MIFLSVLYCDICSLLSILFYFSIFIFSLSVYSLYSFFPSFLLVTLRFPLAPHTSHLTPHTSHLTQVMFLLEATKCIGSSMGHTASSSVFGAQTATATATATASPQHHTGYSTAYSHATAPRSRAGSGLRRNTSADQVTNAAAVLFLHIPSFYVCIHVCLPSKKPKKRGGPCVYDEKHSSFLA